MQIKEHYLRGSSGGQGNIGQQSSQSLQIKIKHRNN